MHRQRIYVTNWSLIFSFLVAFSLTSVYLHLPSGFCSHDFIGEFTTSYKELCRGQGQSNVYEVRGENDRYRYHPLCLLSHGFYSKSRVRLHLRSFPGWTAQ